MQKTMCASMYAAALHKQVNEHSALHSLTQKSTRQNCFEMAWISIRRTEQIKSGQHGQLVQDCLRLTGRSALLFLLLACPVSGNHVYQGVRKAGVLPSAGSVQH